MDLLLGLDGGGTKTNLVLAGLYGPLQGPFRVGGTSLSRNSPAEVAERLRRGCELAFGTLGCSPYDCVAACGGFASASRHAPVFEGLLRGLLPRACVRVITDAELAWHGATRGGDGIVLIAGTGSIAWGRYGGRQARAGGQGPGADPGSGDWIGRQAVAQGIVPPPADRDFAALVPRLEREFWAEADAIFRHAGRELASLLTACARDLQWPDPVAYAMGGVLDNIPVVRQYLRQVWPHVLTRPLASPLEAALELARNLLA